MKTNIKQKTRELFQEKGGIAGNTEYWNKYSRKSVDLFNLFDMVVILNHSLIGVQTTSSDNFALHHKKMIQNEILNYWLDTENKAYLVGWWKKKIKRGGERYKWEYKIREYYLADIHEEPFEKWKTKAIDGNRVVWLEKLFSFS